MLDTYRDDQAAAVQPEVQPEAMGAPATPEEPQPGAPAAPDATPAPPTAPLRADEPPAATTPGAPGYGASYPPSYGYGYGSDYGAGYGATPPPPYAPWSPPTPPARPQRHWASALVAVALLIALAVGGGVGALVASRASAGAPTTGSKIVLGAQSAPNLTVSSTTTSLQQSVETVATAVEPSVVEITARGGSGEAIGSGDILTANGYIVTNDHVVQGFTNFTVTFSNGSTAQAQVVGQDAQDDLAVIKVAATNLKPIALGDSSKLTVGEFSIAIGSPLGLRNTATFGIVSALNRSASEAPDGPAGELTGLIQTSAPINPGNSGGALVNISGQLIGIPTLTATNPESNSAANSIGYAIPVNRVEYVAEQLIAHGSLTSSGQGFIGIEAQDVTPQLAAANGLSVSSGVLVVGFANDAAGQSPAQQAGVRSGDVITAVNGRSVTTNGELASALLNLNPGAQVALSVSRGSSQLTITVTLGERPVNSQG